MHLSWNPSRPLRCRCNGAEIAESHHDLDDAADKLNRSAAFTEDRDRRASLGPHEKLVAPLVATTPQPAAQRGDERKQGKRI